MSTLGIDMAVVMPSKQAAVSGDNSEENEKIARLARTQPDKFVGMALLNPLKEGAPDELTKCVRKLGMKALKLHPYAQCYSPLLSSDDDIGCSLRVITLISLQCFLQMVLVWLRLRA